MQQIDNIFFNEKNNKTEENLSRWPNGKVGIKYAPPDEPICGFDGKKCPEQNEQPGRHYTSICIEKQKSASVV